MMARPTKMMITILCFLCVGKSFSSLIYPCEDVEEEGVKFQILSTTLLITKTWKQVLYTLSTCHEFEIILKIKAMESICIQTMKLWFRKGLACKASWQRKWRLDFGWRKLRSVASVGRVCTHIRQEEVAMFMLLYYCMILGYDTIRSHQVTFQVHNSSILDYRYQYTYYVFKQAQNYSADLAETSP
jgi:hypothetical protein